MTIIEYVCCHDLCGSVDCVSLILVTLRGSFMASWHFGWKILQEDAQLTSFHPTNDLRPHPSVRPSVPRLCIRPSRIRGFLRAFGASSGWCRQSRRSRVRNSLFSRDPNVPSIFLVSHLTPPRQMTFTLRSGNPVQLPMKGNSMSFTKRNMIM